MVAWVQLVVLWHVAQFWAATVAEWYCVASLLWHEPQAVGVPAYAPLAWHKEQAADAWAPVSGNAVVE